MSVSDVQDRPRLPGPALVRPVARRVIVSTPAWRQAPPTAAGIARRHVMVVLAKWLLPLLALLLLSSIAVWPELMRVKDQGRIAFRRAFSVEADTGRMLQPRYRGVDERGRPYTVTAASALQTGPERIALTDPKGDIVTESGTWLMGESQAGVFIQHQSMLDLSGNVLLYREDGTTLRTDAAVVDLKAGAAASSDKTRAEGPFGTLDAQGFTLIDKGAAIQFTGPAHLVLNGAEPR